MYIQIISFMRIFEMKNKKTGSNRFKVVYLKWDEKRERELKSRILNFLRDFVVKNKRNRFYK